MEKMQTFIMAIVIIGVTLIMGIYITDTLQGTFRTEGTTLSFVNVSGSGNLINGTAIYATGYNPSLYHNCVISSVSLANVSSNLKIASGNYTTSGCYITGSPLYLDSTYNNTGVVINATYTYDADTATSNASADITDALSGGTVWITILVVVGFAVIVLGMLSSGLGRAAGESTESQTSLAY
jgi:hypothetical protein